VGVLFTDIEEKLLQNIQNPHDQPDLTIPALYARPVLRNCWSDPMALCQSTFGDTIFCGLGVGWGLSCGTHLPTWIIGIPTLWEFGENGRFFTTSCDPSMGNNLNCFFLHVSPEKRRKGWLLRKMSEVRINLDKMLNYWKDKQFLQI
jgi:hypothetical protein